MIYEIEIKRSWSYNVFFAIGSTGLLAFFLYDMRKTLVNWRTLDTTGIAIFITIFLLFLYISFASWITFLDRRVIYKMTKEGIWHRKNFFKKNLDSLIRWYNIEYVFIEAVNNKGIVTETLIIKIKEVEKYFKITLSGLDKSKEDILNMITEKSKEYNFPDLGLENNTSSKY